MTPADTAENYPSPTLAERRADWAMHIIGMVGFAVASVFLARAAIAKGDALLLLACAAYALGGVSSLILSTAYHLSPWHHHRLLLRRWDHAAIYLIIAGTFSPLLLICGTGRAHIILAVMWVLALVGVWFKGVMGAVESRWSLFSYLGMGGFALLALPDFWQHLPHLSVWLLGAGATFYTVGTLFYRRRGMRYRYPLWHALGTCGGFCLFGSIWVAMTG